MYEDINLNLQEAHQGIQRLQKINSMLEELNIQKNSLTEKVAQLKKKLDKEDIDVERLEGKGLAHIFHSVLGNLDEQLDTERQEALAAKLKYDQAVLELEQVNSDMSGLLSEKERYKDCESTYKQLYLRKKEQLLQSNSQTAEQILNLTEQVNLLKNNRKEINEAMNAGNEAERHLEKAADSLSSARGWGTWDLLGGGLITDLAKHSNIDNAKYEVEKSQAALSRFRMELADVRINSGISIETGGFAKFADFFFDGLIADWLMQSRINQSQESVYNVRNQVQQVLAKLSSMEYEEAGRVEQYEDEINELITQAQ